jgi:FAD/FMN-containing dehydrogenase
MASHASFTETLGRFTSSVRGDVLRPGSAGYDEARAVWNGMIDRRPALIVRCRDTEEVAAAVRFGRESGLPVAVRGGGHSAAGLAVCDDGIVIDLSAMRAVQVDPASRTATAEGGARWSDFDQATQAHGLATTGGAISTTGVAGLTLGGGLGWLMRSYGMACDNLIGAEVVTADGERITASEEENADLLWGLRGGGGNFGVVTKFRFRLHPVSTVLGGMLVFPVERAREVLRFYRDFATAAPDELTTFAGMMTTPDGMRVTAVLPCYNGPIADGEAAIRPLRDLGPVADQVGPMPYLALQTMLDPAFPSGLPVYWRSDFLRALSDDAIDTAVDHFDRVTSPLSAVLFEQFGGAVSRVGPEASAFPHRDAMYNLVIVGRWPDPALADPTMGWVRGLSDAMRPHARGVYVNYLGAGEGEDRVRAAYGPDTYDRLAKLKAKYDPNNFFRLNQNIRPGG